MLDIRILFSYTRSHFYGLALLICVAPVASLADVSQLDEVFVTAQYREQSIRDIPLSASALMGDGLQQRGIQRMEDMTGVIPNLTIYKSAFTNIINIRGVSSGSNQGFEQSVGMFLDGVYWGRSVQSRIPFMDMERVEVLRGAQSVLFGKNTIAGAINLRSARPGESFGGSVSAAYNPDFNGRTAELGVTIPLADYAGLRLAYRRSTEDGFMDNLVDRTTSPSADEESFRLGLSWSLGERLELYGKYQQSDVNTRGRNWEIVLAPSEKAREVYGDDRPNWKHRVSNNTGAFAGTDFAFEYSDLDSRNVSLQLDYHAAPGVFSSISGYSWYDNLQVHDADWSPQAWIGGREHEQYRQYSQEFRFVSEIGDRFDVIAGVYGHRSELTYDERIAVPYFAEVDFVAALGGVDLGLPTGIGVFANASSQVTHYTRDENSYAVFGQLNWRLAERWTLTLGARYTHALIQASQNLFIADLFGDEPYQPEGVDTGEGVGIGPRGADATLVLWGEVNVEPHFFPSERRRFNNLTAGISAQYQWHDTLMSYLRYDRGIKDGGFDPRSVSADPDDFAFDEEKAQTWEVGVKSLLADGRIELNAAGFYSVFSDRQISVFNGGLSFVVSNAGESRSLGIELDGRWRITERWLMSASLAYLDFEWVKYERAGCAPALRGGARDNGDGTCDLSGQSTSASPDFSAFIALDHERPLRDSMRLVSRVAVTHRGETFLNPSNDPLVMQKPYAKLDMRLALEHADGDWSVALLARNITNEHTKMGGTVIPLSEMIAGGLGAYTAVVAPPRSIALQARYNF